jgi:hypothetical protein
MIHEWVDPARSLKKEHDVVHVILVAWLAGMLVLCPQFCGTDVSDQAAHHLDATHSEHGPSPADADDCICQGAVPADQIRVLDTGLIHAANPFASLVPPSLSSADHRAGELSSPGLAQWGTPLAVRAVLQNFRC